MDTISLIAIGLLAATPLLAAVVILPGLATRKRHGTITAAIAAALPDASIVRRDGLIEITTSSTVYLVKVVPMNPAHELILTNRLFWCVNADLKNWKRSTKPDLVPRVKAYLEDVPTTSKKLVRIALIYPGCHRITRYLNESDVEIVRPDKPAEGVHFVTFDKFAEFFTSREK